MQDRRISMPCRYLRGVLACTAFVLGACGGAGSEPQATDERPASVIGDPLHQALERAESVQDTLDDRAADLRQRIEDAAGERSAD
jgi:hypothetical protein